MTSPFLPLDDQQPDTKPGPYYVTALMSGQVYPMAGPYLRHEDALAKVDRARAVACEYDRKAIWAAFGTCRIPDCATVGRLQALGLMS